MYIEFDLADIKTSNEFLLLRKEISNWATRYEIAYKEKTIKLKHRVTFDQDKMYSFWAVTWNPQQHYFFNQYRIVSDLNNKI
jgi:hypothetical protein